MTVEVTETNDMHEEFGDLELEIPMAEDMDSNQMYHIGDEVVCKINDGFIVYRYDGLWETKENFTIIGFWVSDSNIAEYVIYVPEHDCLIQNSFKLSPRMCQQYCVDDKFRDERAAFVRVSQIVRLYARHDG